MKNLIYIFLLIASTNLYAQGGIENDELFLKYEQEYMNMLNASHGAVYEQAATTFYAKFNSDKEKAKFFKTTDKDRWLTKNVSKTKFSSASEAVSAYTTLVNAKTALDNSSKTVEDLRNELIKKYDADLLWKTLKARILAKQ